MAGLPDGIQREIAIRLDEIRAFFTNPKLTLIVRNDIGPGKDADVVVSDDDLELAIRTLEKRWRAA